MRFLSLRKTILLLSAIVLIGLIRKFGEYHKIDDVIQLSNNIFQSSVDVLPGRGGDDFSSFIGSSRDTLATKKVKKNLLKQASKNKGIFPIPGTKHMMISAYVDHRFDNTIRAVTIIRHQELEKLYCHLCDDILDRCNVSLATVEVNPHHWRFPYAAGDVLCDSSTLPGFARVRIANDTIIDKKSLYLLIENLKQEPLRYNFTVCLSLVHSDYNNALQFVQAMETYKILGVKRAAIYNISCGPDVQKVLEYYVSEGTLEVIPWNIHDFMTTSNGWDPKIHGGEIQYHGQIVAVNECLRRYMFQSKYILFHDIDEIFMPYKHNSLNEMMAALEKMYKHANIAYFTIYTFLFSKKVIDNSSRFHLERWRKIPGVNILDHVSSRRQAKHVTKLIVDPRKMLQISIHRIVKLNGGGRKAVGQNLKPDWARLWHTREPVDERWYYEREKTKSEIDKRLWDFEAKLVPNIDRVLKASGFL